MFRDYSPVVLADCTCEPVGSGLPRTNHQELASPLEKEIPAHKCKGVLNSVAKFFTPGSQVEPQKISQAVPQAVIYFAERFLRGL